MRDMSMSREAKRRYATGWCGGTPPTGFTVEVVILLARAMALSWRTGILARQADTPSKSSRQIRQRRCRAEVYAPGGRA